MRRGFSVIHAARASLKPAPFLLPFCLAAVLLLLGAGCAAVRDTQFSLIVPLAQPEPRRVAVLPPLVADTLKGEKLTPENEWWQRLFDSRGAVITSSTPETDVALGLVAALSQGGKYKRVFPAASLEDARRMGADSVIRCEVHDYRTVISGANSRYKYVMLLGPLMPQYWIRWLTLEARVDWEVTQYNLADGRCTFQRRLARSYYRTVRYALPKYLMDKMLRFLTYEAAPEFVADMFMLDTRERDTTAGD